MDGKYNAYTQLWGVRGCSPLSKQFDVKSRLDGLYFVIHNIINNRFFKAYSKLGSKEGRIGGGGLIELYR